MAVGLAGKVRLGQATKQGNAKFSRKDGGVVYKNTDKINPPLQRAKRQIGVGKQSGK